MNATALSIKTLYEDNGHTPEEIAETLGMDLPIIKGVLKAYSDKYAATLGGIPEDVTEAEMKECFGVMKSVLRDTDSTKFEKLTVAKFLINERKGRNDAKVGVVPYTNVNILVINQKLEKALAAQQAALEG